MAFKQHEDHEGWGLGFPMRPLCRAVARGHKELVVALLDAGADFAASETDDRLDCSAMTEALMATNALVEIVQALIDRGADVNQWHHVEWTPLIQAVINDDLEIAKLLLDNGADPNMEDAGYTPIEIGIHHGRPAVVQMLREHGALTVEERLFPGYR
jgi:ankyrin repeat protein